MRVIINADDCGRTVAQNRAIERAILSEKITSTSIMANMPELDGAISLYRSYRETISFGVHLNLTEGEPLRYSQELLDLGFYKQEGNRILFNGFPFIRKFISKTCLEDVRKELIAQVTMIRDYGVELSHIDSHNHIHTANFMLFLLPSLCEELKIYNVRNIRNLLAPSVSRSVRNLWTILEKTLCSQMKFTEKFTSFTNFLEWEKRMDFKTIEIMCHPGHPSYISEELKLHQYEIPREYQLINYYQL